MINKNSTTEFIQAEKSAPSPRIWQFSPLDQICLHMVIRGTWLFAGQLDVDAIKESLKKLLVYYPHLSGRMKEASGITLTTGGKSAEIMRSRSRSWTSQDSLFPADYQVIS